MIARLGISRGMSIGLGRVAFLLSIMDPGVGFCQTSSMAQPGIESTHLVASPVAAFGGLLKDADLFYQQGRYDRAVELLSAGLAQGLAHPSLWLRLGNALHHLQRLDEAQAFYRQAAQYPLPDGLQIGFIEATRTRSKALLNLASLNLSLANIALAEFRRYGIANSEQNLVLQEQSRLAEALNSLKGLRGLSGDPWVSNSPPTVAETSSRIDSAVTVEYLSGGPQRASSLKRSR